jgi:hypothetical protein
MVQYDLFITPHSPLVVHYGGGVDSTAMLIGMQQRDIHPELILFADVGAEKPETIEYVAMFSDWLVENGMEPVTTVRRFGADGTHGWKSKPSKMGDGYQTLEGNLLQNDTLPSLAYGRHSCSAKFKVDPQEKFIKNWRPAQEAWHVGEPVRRAIGFDCSPADQRRTYRTTKYDNDQFQSWFPLHDWEWDRAECIRQIVAVGLPVPIKSACYFCPASKEWEVLWLAGAHPELFLRAIEIEDRAMPNAVSVEGLWRSSTKARAGNWRTWAEGLGILAPGGCEVVLDKGTLLAMAAERCPEEQLLSIAA